MQIDFTQERARAFAVQAHAYPEEDAACFSGARVYNVERSIHSKGGRTHRCSRRASRRNYAALAFPSARV
jgi:hypothetical protein